MTHETKPARPRKSSCYHTRLKVGLLGERTAKILRIGIDEVLALDVSGNALAERNVAIPEFKARERPRLEWLGLFVSHRSTRLNR
jgi:hypothetical protein